MNLGSYIVKCVKPGGDSLALYGFTASEAQEGDLLDPATPDNIRAIDFITADNMCRDPGLELAQKIKQGTWVVVRRRDPGPGGVALEME